MKTEGKRILPFSIFSHVLFGAILFCCYGCIVSNHLFIPLEAQNKTDEIIQGDGYKLECYAMYAFADILEITTESKSSNQVKISEIKPYWISEGDTIYAQLKYNYKGTYKFLVPEIKKRKNLNVLVEYRSDRDTTNLIQNHSLRRVKNSHFSVH